MNLLQIARAVVTNPAFASKDITGDGKAETFCNWGVRLIANAVWDYPGFDNLSANQITELVKTNTPQFTKVTGMEASAAAEKGRMVIAAQAAATGSGHVAMVVPGAMVQSGKWGKSCPVVANVGKTNGIMGANHAFATEPEYFVFTFK